MLLANGRYYSEGVKTQMFWLQLIPIGRDLKSQTYRIQSIINNLQQTFM